MISKTIHDQTYEVYSWTEIGKYTFELGKKILESGTQFDRVVALARGGVSIAQSTADLIGVKHISVVQSELYTGIASKAKIPVITQSLSVTVRGEKLLLIDDLADSGESLLFARQYLSAHGPEDIKTATLAVKPWTKLTPDFTVLGSEAWIIFPWEVHETIHTLALMWQKVGDTREQIVANLTELGYSKEQIETFLQA